MIVSHLLGGLGNQMFQYAAGRALSLRFGVPLKLDVSGFEAYGLHQGFELQHVFTCQVDLADRDDIRTVLGWQSPVGIRRILANPCLAFLRRKCFVAEPHFHYWPGMSDVPSECYLTGYWQSEKYFSFAEADIRKDFTFKKPLIDRNLELSAKMATCSSVSLHIRRGDYVSDAQTSAVLGVCSLDYYRNAVAYVADRVANPHFFVFSDDIEWARENLRLDHPSEYIDHNRGAESYRDMQLMSKCRHHIIANSSFSWWGAWLNPHSDKIVVAPKNWFIVNYRTDDLIPPKWITL